MDKTKYLSVEDLRVLAEIVKKEIERKGADFYGWKNAPVAETDGSISHTSGWGDNQKKTSISAKEALAVMEEKINGAYGERFALSIAVAIAAAKNGKKVALLQKLEEPGLPFNAEGWAILSIEGYPNFHIAPWDLPMSSVENLVTLVVPGSEEEKIHGYKGTNKVSEFAMILDWMF